jgi:lipid-A-disaccharide synthase
MARWVDRLAVVFPFEEPIFRDAGVTTRFVGHPLLDDLVPEVGEAALRAELEVAPDRPLLALLPGSRAGEVSRLLRPMLEAAAILRLRRPDLAVAVAGAEGLPDALYERQRRHGSVVVPVLRGRTHSLQAHATACAVASGTATLETALLGTPHVIVYRVGAINYAIASRLVTLERIGLPNIVAGEEVAPELVQGALTPEALAARLAPWLEDPSRRQVAAGRLARVRERLGGPGASAAAAGWLWELAA